MKLKKLSALLMISVLAISTITGCQSKTTETSTGEAKETTEAEDTQSEETTKEAPATEEEAITTTLTVWGPSEDQSTEYGNWLPTMCEQFATEHPNWNITFEYGVCAEGDAKKTIVQDSEAAADVYMFANDNLPELIAAGAISKLGGETAEYVKSTNSQAIVDSVSIDGDIYGVPFTTNTWLMYYDKSVFTEEDVKNLDAMLAKGKVAFPLSNSWYVASFFVANGGTMFGDGTDEAAAIDFSGDKGTAVTNYLVDLVANPNFLDDANGVGISGLRDGSVSAIFSGAWDCKSVKEALGDNFGAIQLPTITIDGQKKQLMSFAGSKAIGVNSNCEYPQVAVALAKYLGGVNAQKAHYELRSVVPCNTELLADAAVQSDALVAAQNNTFDNTSIIQPFVAAMSNYWTPAENFGKSLINKEITHDNAAEKTEEFNTSMNTTLVE